MTTTDVVVADGPVVDTEQERWLSQMAELAEKAYAISAEDFSGLKVADRDLLMFVLVRELAGSVRTMAFQLDELNAKVFEYEEKAKAMATPEGLQELMAKVMGGGMGGSSGGGMFGGLFS